MPGLEGRGGGRQGTRRQSKGATRLGSRCSSTSVSVPLT